MQNYIEKFEAKQILESGNQVPELKVGDLVEVHNRVIERAKKGESKERIQIFAGTIVAYMKGGFRSAITVRKISSGMGVEKKFPLYSSVVGGIRNTASGTNSFIGALSC